MEKLSAHPIARSIHHYFANCQDEISFEQFQEQPGLGVSGVYQHQMYQLLSYQTALAKGFQNQMELAVQKITVINPILIALVINKTITNVIILTDTIRFDAQLAITKFTKKHITTHMISGDNEQTTKAIANEVGITSYYANVSPLIKATIVAAIQAAGNVIAYVGRWN